MEKKKEYLRCLMLFYFRKNKTATDTKRKICAVYGEDAVSERVVQIWFSKFRKGDTSCVDGQRTGRPGVADCDKVRMLIERYPHFTTKKIGELINMSEKTVADYLQRLGYVADGDGWRYDDSVVAKSTQNNYNTSSENEEEPTSQLVGDDEEQRSVEDAEIIVYCNKEFAYDEPTATSLNCNVQIASTESTTTNISTPSQQQQQPSLTTIEDCTYNVGITDISYEDINEEDGKENHNSTGNTNSKTLPSFSEYFSDVYTSYLRGDGGTCAIENRNIYYVDNYNGAYPLKSCD